MSIFGLRLQPVLALTTNVGRCPASVLLCALVIAVAAQSGDAAEQVKSRAEPNGRIAEFSVYDDGDLLLLPVMMGPTEQLFFLDTGASHSICDSALAHLLGRRLRQIDGTAPDGGKITSSLHELPNSVTINGVRFPPNTAITVYDLESLRRISGHDVVGAVGMDFVKNLVLDINLDRGEVSFLRPPKQMNQQAIELQWVEDHIPSVMAWQAAAIRCTLQSIQGLAARAPAACYQKERCRGFSKPAMLPKLRAYPRTAAARNVTIAN